MSDEATETVSAPNYTRGSTTCKNEEGDGVTLEYDWGATLEEMIDKYGAEAVHYHACASVTRSQRNKLYSLLTAGDEPSTPDEARAEMENWVPKATAGRSKKTPTDKALAAFGEMSADQRKAFIEQMKVEAGIE